MVENQHDHPQAWNSKDGGPRLLSWSIQWAVVLAVPILAVAYLLQFILQGTVTWTPLQWGALVMGTSLGLLWLHWLRDGSFKRKT
jgi:low affinity Fe/Cu permease